MLGIHRYVGIYTLVRNLTSKIVRPAHLPTGIINNVVHKTPGYTRLRKKAQNYRVKLFGSRY